jgi:hypothetical protein
VVYLEASKADGQRVGGALVNVIPQDPNRQPDMNRRSLPFPFLLLRLLPPARLLLMAEPTIRADQHEHEHEHEHVEAGNGLHNAVVIL